MRVWREVGGFTVSGRRPLPLPDVLGEVSGDVFVDLDRFDVHVGLQDFQEYCPEPIGAYMVSPDLLLLACYVAEIDSTTFSAFELEFEC